MYVNVTKPIREEHKVTSYLPLTGVAPQMPCCVRLREVFSEC